MSENMVTMVFTDLVNSTAVKNHLPGSDITARNRIYRDKILLPHRKRVEASLAEFGGRKVETIGDAFFLVFANPIMAVEWAVAIQKSHINYQISTPLGALQLTIGIHTGCPLADGDRFIGQEVDHTARVAALATGGQILLSEVTAVCVRNAKIADLELHCHGERDLKGIGGVPIFEVIYNDKKPQPLKESEPIKFGGIGSVIDWRSNCREMLAQHRRLTTNPLTTGDGLGFELDDIYVPLGLVERKQQNRYSGDVSPDRGSQLYEPEIAEETVQTFQQEEFFEQVLCSESSKRIAIIGEPGAGKTTLLQKIAVWILENTEDLPIWISLADLQGKTLEQYLLTDWLKAVTRKVRVTQEMEDALGELFNSGRVWLLLDAVDEMVTDSVNALGKIANQLNGWIADARVVLTSRINVWDAGKNALESFDTYRNLDFSYGDSSTPDKVHQFMRCWFKDNPALGDRLRSELDKSGRERIKDAVKNPLRLALLCRTWNRQQGELPNTKAGLYQQFIESLYEWKQDRFPTTSTQRQKLNQALGKLALRAIAEEKTKFRLRHRLLESVLGKPDEELFQLALVLGFLNQVGVAAEAENRGEKVYAFYHPTFQEYFAALAIPNWHYFLNHKSGNRESKQGRITQSPRRGGFPNPPLPNRQSLVPNYRIFESQWKEVILLWLGREDVPNEQKEEFIKALVNFPDECGDFYQYRSGFLAAAGIAEFRDCSCADEIVAQIIKWGYGYFNVEKHKWCTYLKPIEQGARAALFETDRGRAIAALEQLIDSVKSTSACWRAAYNLGKFFQPGNQKAIAAMVRIIETASSESIRRKAAESLAKIDPGNAIAIQILIQIIDSAQNQSIRRQAAYTLGKIDPGNSIAIQTLLQIIESTEDETTRRQAAESLGKIEPGNSRAIATLLQIFETTQSQSTRQKVASTLRQIDPTNSTLSQKFESERNQSHQKYRTSKLKQIDPSNPTAIATFEEIIKSSKSEYTRRQAAESLGKIDPHNSVARTALAEIIRSTDNEYTRRQAAENLGKIDPSNPVARTALREIIETSENESIRRLASETLLKIDPGNSTAIAALVQIIQTTQNQSTLKRVAERLSQIIREEQFEVVVTALKSHLSNETETNDFERFNEYYKLIWHCAQNITYSAFSQAWHNQSTPTHSEVPETVCVDSNPIAQNLNLAELPRLLTAAISNDSDISDNVKIIWIDGSKFIEPDNPAAEIYIEMVEQGCPERQQGEPTTMQALKVYCKQLKSDKRIVLVFYETPTKYQTQGFSHSVLTALGKFDMAICAIAEQPLENIPLKWFFANQPMLIEDMVKWIRTMQDGI